MDDMKILFDTTAKEFDRKLIAKVGEVERTYARLMEKQKTMMIAFEIKYSNKIQQRLEYVEQLMENIAIEQARLAAGSGIIRVKSSLEDIMLPDRSQLN